MHPRNKHATERPELEAVTHEEASGIAEAELRPIREQVRPTRADLRTQHIKITTCLYHMVETTSGEEQAEVAQLPGANEEVDLPAEEWVEAAVSGKTTRTTQTTKAAGKAHVSPIKADRAQQVVTQTI